MSQCSLAFQFKGTVSYIIICETVYLHYFLSILLSAIPAVVKSHRFAMLCLCKLQTTFERVIMTEQLDQLNTNQKIIAILTN